MFKSRKISLLLHAKGKCASLSGSLNLYRQKSTIPESLRSTVFTSNIDTSSISASISTPTPTPTPTTTALSTADFRTKHDISISGDLNDNLFEPLVDFSSTPFFEPLKRALLKEGFTAPTPIQAQSWPILLSGRDLISVARTGSGKTCGFLLPALQKILTSAKSAPNSRNPKILVLAPTRELSVQINEVASNFSRSLGLRNICLYGGTMRGPQMSSLRAGVDIIVGTPGRVFDLLSEGCFRVKDIQYVVFDEADRM